MVERLERPSLAGPERLGGLDYCGRTRLDSDAIEIESESIAIAWTLIPHLLLVFCFKLAAACPCFRALGLRLGSGTTLAPTWAKNKRGGGRMRLVRRVLAPVLPNHHQGLKRRAALSRHTIRFTSSIASCLCGGCPRCEAERRALPPPRSHRRDASSSFSRPPSGAHHDQPHTRTTPTPAAAHHFGSHTTNHPFHPHP